jgi:ATPase subunit of ABC transporter with duplicated ATPase domains
MMAEANALLFDEPTDHLDLESISALNNGLIVFPEMVMVISQDFELLNTVVNRIIEVTPAGMRDYHGTFEDFVGRG